MKQKVEFKKVGYTTVKMVVYIDTIIDADYETDTAVFIGNYQLCSVAGEDRHEFIQKLFELVEEYRI